MSATIERKEVVIKFAGDSGDGMQLAGNQFTNTTALMGNDLGTFPDYPAEIRAPQGTLAGVSGFQIHFGSGEITTPGDDYDVLVAMNAAALKSNLDRVKRDGILILNTSGFDSKNLRLAHCDTNPLEDGSLDGYTKFEMDVTKLTVTALKESTLGRKDKDRAKNMFVLGFLYWMYNRPLDSTINFLSQKFGKKPEILDANIAVLKAGYHYAETTETFTSRYEVPKAKMPAGRYRNIMGNEGLAMGLTAAARKAGLTLFYGSYPITPASDILHALAQYKKWGVVTFQAEDEIAAVSSVIGAAYGGNLAVTGTSGPGVSLKGEAIGLAMMLELPMVICNIQRAGPSTGMPTKTEQADLMQALYGRHGETPLPVIAVRSPSNAFKTAFEACRIAIEHRIPVMLLSDGYIANGAEPWAFPKLKDLPAINPNFEAAPEEESETPFRPYQRDEKLARPWVKLGVKGLEHRVGGLEKEHLTGNVSYDPKNHEFMTHLRQERVDIIAESIPLQDIDSGEKEGDVLVLGWGSTYGVCRSVVQDLLKEGYKVAHAHLTYLNPFPKNLGELMQNYKKVLIPEINNGQLQLVIRSKFLIETANFNKIQGLPISKAELRTAILDTLSQLDA